MNSDKGAGTFKKIEDTVSYVETNYLDALKYNSAATKSPLVPQRRSEFLKEISINGFTSIREKFFKISSFSKVKKKIKRLIKGRK